MVLLEAMYAGCPVVCSRVGGIPEVIDDETNGFCIEPNNPQILSEKLLALLKDPSLGKRVARNARIKVKRSLFNPLRELQEDCQTKIKIENWPIPWH